LQDTQRIKLRESFLKICKIGPIRRSDLMGIGTGF
jgi:hypothetical protein